MARPLPRVPSAGHAVRLGRAPSSSMSAAPSSSSRPSSSRRTPRWPDRPPLAMVSALPAIRSRWPRTTSSVSSASVRAMRTVVSPTDWERWTPRTSSSTTAPSHGASTSVSPSMGHITPPYNGASLRRASATPPTSRKPTAMAATGEAAVPAIIIISWPIMSRAHLDSAPVPALRPMSAWTCDATSSTTGSTTVSMAERA